MRSGHSRDSTTAEVGIWGRCRTNWISVQYIGASKDSNTKCLAPCGLCAPLLKRRNWATSDIERQLRVGEVLWEMICDFMRLLSTPHQDRSEKVEIQQAMTRLSAMSCQVLRVVKRGILLHPGTAWLWSGAPKCHQSVCSRMFQADPHFVLSSTYPRARTCRLQSLSWRCRLHCPGNHTDLQADWVKQTDALTNVTMTKTKSH